MVVFNRLFMNFLYKKSKFPGILVLLMFEDQATNMICAGP